MLAGPDRRVARDLVEVAGVLEAARRLVVVAADDRERLERADAIDHAVGLAAVADQVAEDERCSQLPAAAARTASSASMLAWMSERIR